MERGARGRPGERGAAAPGARRAPALAVLADQGVGGALRVKLPGLGLRGRLGHLSIAIVAALAATLGWLLDREIATTIRSSSDQLLGRAQPLVAATAVALLERGDDPALAK